MLAESLDYKFRDNRLFKIREIGTKREMVCRTILKLGEDMDCQNKSPVPK